MKITSHKVTRQSDTVTVEAKWISKFKKPMGATVAINAKGAEHNQLITGDVLDVHGFLFGCASIAWSLGWRPAGFTKKLSEWIDDYRPST